MNTASQPKQSAIDALLEYIAQCRDRTHFLSLVELEHHARCVRAEMQEQRK